MIETTLIIPDLHLKMDQADKIIKHVGADKVICLGDIFDDFVENPESVRNAAEWYVDFVNNPNHIMLWGNHCQHYGFVYRSFQCSGYEQWKYFLINDIVDRKTWDKVKWYHFLDGKWLLSHGGLHNLNVPKNIKKYYKDRTKFISKLSEYLDVEICRGFQLGSEGVGSWVFNAGHARWGSQRVGGITWCDFQREFFPVKGINQIVGHTPIEAGTPHWCLLERDPLNSDGKVSYRYENGETFFKPEDLDDTELSFNLDLDVWQNIHWAVWNGKKLTFGNYKDL